MPYTLRTPVVTSETTTTCRIEAYEVSGINEPGGPRVAVQWTEGEIVSGRFVERARKSAKLSTDAVTALSNFKTIYADNKAALYKLLKSGGHIGDGKASR